MSSTYLRRVYWRLAGAIMLVVVAALAANAYLSHRIFERSLAPEMAAKVASVGASVRVMLLKSVEQGFEFRGLYGIEPLFDDARNDSPEIAYFALTDPEGKLLRQHLSPPSGAADYFRSAGVLGALAAPERVPPARRVGEQYLVSLPIVSATQGPLGTLHLGVDVKFVDDIVLEMLYDVIVILVVSLFFTLELLHFMAGARLEAALRALSDAFERGASGRFAAPLRRATGRAMTQVQQLLEAMLARVNSAYEQLARDAEAARRVPAHERPQALAAVHAGVQALGRRFGFGVESSERRGDDTELAKVRMPLFMFILAEELTRPFLPGYVKSLLVSVPWLSPEILVGLPIALFMLIVAIAQPWLGVICERNGTRHTMLLGASVAAAGFVASAFAATVFDLMLWRSLCALGYAMVFVSGQAYVLAHATSANRAKSFALFVGAIMVASICGPSIGGILADNIGERWTFGIAALLALGSLAAIRSLPDAKVREDGQAEARVPTLAEIGALLGNLRFLTVTALAAMPAKTLLTGVCFYLVPLYVLSIGGSQSAAGRILMTYAVLMAVVSPFAAAWATTRERMEWLVGGGLIVSGLGAALLLAGGETHWVFAAVTLIGLGQSMSISAQSALVSEHCRAEIERIGEGAVYGVYRLLERLGNALGPIVAATLVVLFGYRTGFVALGAFVVLCGAAFVLATRRGARAIAVPA
jgi:MFS family permease